MSLVLGMIKEKIFLENLVLLIFELLQLGGKGKFGLGGVRGQLLTFFFLGEKVLEVHHDWVFFLKYIRNLVNKRSSRLWLQKGHFERKKVIISRVGLQ